MKFTSQDNLLYFWLKLKAKLSTVAFSGKYSDLSGKPTSLPANGGNSNTANTLSTPRKINGVSFDGSKDISIKDNTKSNVQVSTTQPTNQETNDIWYRPI